MKAGLELTGWHRIQDAEKIDEWAEAMRKGHLVEIQGLMCSISSLQIDAHYPNEKGVGPIISASFYLTFVMTA